MVTFCIYITGGKSLEFENIKDAVAYFQHDERDTAKDWAVLRIFDGRQSIRHWFPLRHWCPTAIPPTDDNLVSRVTFKPAKGKMVLLETSKLMFYLWVKFK